MSSLILADGFLADFGRVVDGGGRMGCSSSKVPASERSALVMPLLVRRARERAERILRDWGRTLSVKISMSCGFFAPDG